MSTNTSFDDHLNAKGQIDFDSYHRAKKANGEDCMTCGQMVSIWGGDGHPKECHQCKSSTKDEEFRHDNRVRCPKCSHAYDPYEAEQYELLKEDGDEVYCPECDHLFYVSTTISYSFTSPELIKEPE